MADIIFTEKGWEQYLEWQSEDKKTLKRINALIRDAQRRSVRNCRSFFMAEPELP